MEEQQRPRPLPRQYLRRVGWALLTGLAIFGITEATLRLFRGPPPLPSGVARAYGLRMVEQDGRWLARRGVDGRLRSFPTHDGRPRVGILGGSSVMQDPIDGPQNFPHWLQRALPEVQILNLGTPGASSSGLAMLAGELSVLELDAVVVYSGHNDFGNLLMGGELDTSARWQIRGQQFLSRSWVHAGLRLLLVQEPMEPLYLSRVQDRLVFTESDLAQQQQAQTAALLVSNLRVLAQDANVPVLWVPPISNFHHAPQGMRSSDPACKALAETMPRRRPERANLRAGELGQACGEETALGHWLQAHAAVDRREQAQALSHFHTSLALDPTPLRLPVVGREGQLELAGELGHPAVNLWAQEPIWEPTDFVDPLHFSGAGAKKVADLLAPEIQALLQPPR
jgi:lysophospholipase L1-like esterase